MENHKKILEQQLLLLSEKSKSANNEDLCKLTQQMTNLILLTDPALQTQFSAAQFSLFPALTMLSVQDLTDLHFGRYAHKTRPDIFQKKIISHRGNFQ